LHTIAIGLLGGSFNPPHNAHIALALAARLQLNLSRVDLMPAGQPWQKIQTPLAATSDRIAMCQAAVADIDGLGLELCETQRSGNTYTVDTLRHLRAAHPQHHYSLIIGSDQASRFDTWHDWQSVLGLCRLAVVARNGAAPVLPPAVRALCQSFDTLHLPALNLSSSLIRAQLAAGQSIENQVPAAVERYIVKHSLYKPL
jgi:nicotinate-nucleotide adenylyltransferase